MMRYRSAFAVVILLTLSGCSAHRGKPKEAVDVAAAMRTVAEFRSSSYKIGPADLLSVSVYPDQQLNRKARVDADGAVSLPLIGTTTVAGMTVLEAEKLLGDKLSAYLVNPHVSLFIEQFGNRQMFVLGEVSSPGSYPIPAGSRLTVLQAISTAGGFTKVAQPRRTHVLRYVDGQSVDRVIDLKAVSRGGEVDHDLVLEPNDIVYVPQSLF